MFEFVFLALRLFIQEGNFNSNFIKSIARRIGIKTTLINSSDMPIIEGFKDDRLARICKFLEADTYLSPIGAANYIEQLTPGGELANSHIEVFYHAYKHPEYLQLHGTFIPYMGIFDCLFNVGFDNSLNVIRLGRQNSIHYENYLKILD